MSYAKHTELKILNEIPLPDLRRRVFFFMQRMKQIAIQGIRGSFHDIAAHQYFSNDEVELICCDTFEQIFQEMRDDYSRLGLMAIENTIAGSLLHNFDLLRESGMTIVGEHKLHIEHSIMCLPEDDWDTLSEVNFHPVALM